MERLTVGAFGIGTTSLLCGDLFHLRKQDGYPPGSRCLAAVSGIHTLLDEFLMRMARVVEYAYAMSTPESMARWVSFHRQRLK